MEVAVSLARIYKFCSTISLYAFCLSIIGGNNDIVTLVGVLFSLPYYASIFNGLKFTTNKYFFFLFSFLLIGSLFNILFSSNGIGGTIVIIGVLSLSTFIIQNRIYIYKHVLIVVLVYLLFFSYKIFFQQIDPNEIYVGMSRNYVGLILVMFNVLYSFVYYDIFKRPDLIICTATLIMSFFLVGRSTIGTQLMLVSVNFYVLLKGRKVMLLFFLVILLILLLGVFKDDIELLFRASGFGGYGLDTPRYEIWEDFFKHADFLNYILGLDSAELPIAGQYNGNLHNEFLNLIARTGIGGIAFIITYCLSFFLYIHTKNYYLLSLLLVASVRITFDTGVFINSLGLTFYSIVLYPLFFKIVNNQIVKI